jgi:tetratricopeptide (TPR) repeat protein
MHVADVVTGHYLKEGDQLRITVEAVDVENNSTLWRDTMSVAAPDMIAMRSQITSQVRQGLVPALGAGMNSDSGTHPRNEEAYGLFLHTLSMAHDPTPNKDAIAMLERAVDLDPAFAPAWNAVGLRYHYDAAYSTGGEAMFQRSNAAFERALALDPNLVEAASQLITNRVERNELVKGYQEAKTLVEQHPEKAEGHFALSYVLRYGGALEESAHECDAAYALDPGDYTLRSCGFTFDQLVNYSRAMDFVRLDAGSKWSRGNTIRHLLRDGNVEQARALLKPGDPPLVACSNAGLSPLNLGGRDLTDLMKDPDPEVHYVVAHDFIFCGQKDAAMQLLTSAVAGHFCAYAGLQNDSVWAKLRGTPEFEQLLSSAKACRDNFLSQRAQATH